jgi:hypothetical protein
VRSIVDDVLDRLPEKYRTALVLCYLEGKTNEQVARELGWPPGSMSRHLAKGRELLREQLHRCGVALSVHVLATLLAENASAAAVPATLRGATVQASLLFVVGKMAAVSPAVLLATQAALRDMTLKPLTSWRSCCWLWALRALPWSPVSTGPAPTALSRLRP